MLTHKDVCSETGAGVEVNAKIGETIVGMELQLFYSVVDKFSVMDEIQTIYLHILYYSYREMNLKLSGNKYFSIINLSLIFRN